MKFTEEQYQKIVYAWDFEDTYAEATQAVIDVISVFVTRDLQDEALAIANPLTRYWAHEQFVEKEKKYVWTSKKPYYQGLYKRLFMSLGGYVGYKTLEANNLEVGENEYLTETEVRENGYAPEWFNKLEE